jgi:hypothetical protein
MSQAYVKVQMFRLPNFMRITDAGEEAPMLDVGHLFPTDADATEFWEGCLTQWLEHVAKRRKILAETPDNGT